MYSAVFVPHVDLVSLDLICLIRSKLNELQRNSSLKSKIIVKSKISDAKKLWTNFEKILSDVIDLYDFKWIRLVTLVSV